MITIVKKIITTVLYLFPKKKIPFLLFLFSISGFAYSQSLIGLSAGPVFSSYYDHAEVSGNIVYHPQNSYDFGVLFRERKEHLINLYLKADYSIRKFNITSSYGGIDFDVSSNVNYAINSLGIDVIPDISFGKKLKYYFTVGPGLLIITSSKGNGLESGNNPVNGNYTKTVSGDASDKFSGTLVKLNGGIGIEIGLFKNIKFTVDALYSYGLGSLIGGYIKSYTGNLKFQDFLISSGILYSLNSFTLSKYLKKL